MMANIINLNKFRKKKKRAEEEKQAEENRVIFGRAKGQRKNDARDADKLGQHVDAHKIDDSDSTE